MITHSHSLSFQRQRRFYTVLPLLIIPCVTFIFWVLGGGSGQQPFASGEESGFNASLPEPFLKDGPVDKLAFYEKADRDSLRLAELQKADPYYTGQTSTKSLASDSKLLGLPDKKQQVSSPDEIQVGINQKLEELNRIITAKQEAPTLAGAIPSGTVGLSEENLPATDLDRLEKMIESIHQPSSVPDPEMVQIDQMLEKVLDIQYPERVEQRLAEQSRIERGKVFTVSGAEDEWAATCLDCGISPVAALSQTAGFYGFEDEAYTSPSAVAIQAVVHETQEIVEGSTIKLRLTDDVFVNGVMIPKDQFVYGIASLNGERLQIRINSIRYEQSLFPVALKVFDLDGLDGIHIPGAITRDAAKQSGDRAIQSVGLTTFDRSIGAQAAATGIELSRNLLSRKVRLIRVTVKAGYQVLLRDEKQLDA